MAPAARLDQRRRPQAAPEGTVGATLCAAGCARARSRRRSRPCSRPEAAACTARFTLHRFRVCGRGPNLGEHGEPANPDSSEDTYSRSRAPFFVHLTSESVVEGPRSLRLLRMKTRSNGRQEQHLFSRFHQISYAICNYMRTKSRIVLFGISLVHTATKGPYNVVPYGHQLS